jgi:hypothetical protein
MTKYLRSVLNLIGVLIDVIDLLRMKTILTKSKKLFTLIINYINNSISTIQVLTLLEKIGAFRVSNSIK